MSSETNNSPPAGRRAPRWLWIAFFVSIAINLLVAGMAIGAVWHHKSGKIYRDSGAPRHFRAFLRKLPKDRRKIIREAFRERRPEFRSIRENVAAARRDAEAILTKEPYDKAAFSAANRKLHEARSRLRGAQIELFPEIAELMTAEERAMFLEWRRKHRKRWRRWRRRNDDNTN